MGVNNFQVNVLWFGLGGIFQVDVLWFGMGGVEEGQRNLTLKCRLAFSGASRALIVLDKTCLVLITIKTPLVKKIV